MKLTFPEKHRTLEKVTGSEITCSKHVRDLKVDLQGPEHAKMPRASLKALTMTTKKMLSLPAIPIAKRYGI